MRSYEERLARLESVTDGVMAETRRESGRPRHELRGWEDWRDRTAVYRAAMIVLEEAGDEWETFNTEASRTWRSRVATAPRGAAVSAGAVPSEVCVERVGPVFRASGARCDTSGAAVDGIRAECEVTWESLQWIPMPGLTRLYEHIAAAEDRWGNAIEVNRGLQDRAGDVTEAALEEEGARCARLLRSAGERFDTGARVTDHDFWRAFGCLEGVLLPDRFQTVLEELENLLVSSRQEHLQNLKSHQQDSRARWAQNCQELKAASRARAAEVASTTSNRSAIIWPEYECLPHLDTFAPHINVLASELEFIQGVFDGWRAGRRAR